MWGRSPVKVFLDFFDNVCAANSETTCAISSVCVVEVGWKRCAGVVEVGWNR